MFKIVITLTPDGMSQMLKEPAQLQRLASMFALSVESLYRDMIKQPNHRL